VKACCAEKAKSAQAAESAGCVAAESGAALPACCKTVQK
jgi:hypothetical protein